MKVISRARVTTVAALCGLTTACGGAVANGSGSLPAPSATAAATAAAEPMATPPSSGGVSAKPLAGKTVVIDPGHNGGNYKNPKVINRQVNVLTKWKPCDTTGTSTNNGYSEAAFNWDVSQRLVKILKDRGATVKLTRPNNTGVGPCITQRAAIGNKAKADAAISVHADGSAAGNHGFHVIMPKKIDGPVDPVVGDSRKLGIAVRDALKSGGQPYSTYIGAKGLDFRNDLGGLNLSTVPKIFVEFGNMRNAKEAAAFQTAKFRQKMATSLADGLQKYLN
ncbi:N-acetylmuramoyl-L-alanine amidase [Streptosporangium soli]|nr:N-acetylmuramoyl-L-alanine amidase [Streptosporangium sp. KLBMP 9127]